MVVLVGYSTVVFVSKGLDVIDIHEIEAKYEGPVFNSHAADYYDIVPTKLVLMNIYHGESTWDKGVDAFMGCSFYPDSIDSYPIDMTCINMV